MANPIKIMIDAAEASGPLQSIALMAAFMVAVLYCVALACEWSDARRKRMTERTRAQARPAPIRFPNEKTRPLYSYLGTYWFEDDDGTLSSWQGAYESRRSAIVSCDVYVTCWGGGFKSTVERFTPEAMCGIIGGKFETIHERKRCPFEAHYTAEAERRAHNLR